MTDKTLDLLIRAQVQGGKDLGGVAKSISKIGDAIEEQSAAAKQGENRIDELKASLEALALLQKDLSGQSKVVTFFNKLGDAVATAEGKVTAAANRHAELEKKIKDAGKATDAQQRTLDKYAKSLAAAQSALAKKRNELSELSDEFTSAGIALDSLSARQRENEKLQADIGIVYARGKDAMLGYNAAVREAHQEQAAAAKEVDLFARAEKRAADAAAERAKGEAELVAAMQRRRQEEANRKGEVVAAARADAEARQQINRQAELSALRRDITERSAAAAQLKGFKDTAKGATDNAKELTKLARSHDTLSKAADSLTPKVGSLRDSIAEILEPTKVASRTIQDLERDAAEMADSVSKITGPVKDYKDQVDRLQAAQKSLSSQAGLIDNFNRQAVALRNARAEFVQARAKVNEYAAKVAEGGEEAALFAQKLTKAQAELKGASEQLAKQINLTRQSRTALRDAGISTTDLAGAQRRLNEVAKSTVGTLSSLNKSVDNYGNAVEKTTRKKRLFGDEGRTTLSLMQRIRGQVLSLTAAYVSLFGVIEAGRSAITATVTRDAINSRVAVSLDSNDPEKIEQEYKRLGKMADYYGINVRELTNSNASYAIAARAAGYTDEQRLYTFEQIIAATRVMKLETHQVERVMAQINQILGKGKPEQDDLNSIAENGFVQVRDLMARGLRTIGVEGVNAGTEIADFYKLTQKGALNSGTAIFALARQAEIDLGGRVPSAIKTMAAEQGRFATSLYEFQQEIANSGWAEAYKNTLVELSTLMRSEDGIAAAKTLGNLFTGLAKAVIWVAKNIEAVKNGLIAIGLVYSGGFIFGLLKSVRGWGDEFARWGKIINNNVPTVGRLTGAIATLTTRFPVLTATVLRSLSAITGFFIGWEIGKWANERFQVVREAGVYAATYVAEAWAIFSASYKATLDVLPAWAQDAFGKVLNRMTLFVRAGLGLFATMADAAGFGDMANSLDDLSRSMMLSTNNTEAALAKHRAALDKERAMIREIRQDMLREAAGLNFKNVAGGGRGFVNPARVNPSFENAPLPPSPPSGPPRGDKEAAAKKLASDIKQLETALDALEERALKQDADTLTKQVGVIEREFNELKERIAAIGGATGKAFMERLESARTALIANATNDFNDKLLGAQESFLKKTEDLEEQSGKRSKNNRDLRIAAIRSDYAQAQKELAEIREKFVENGRDTAELDAMKQRLLASESQRIAQEQLNIREQELNDIITARDTLLSAVNTEAVDGAERINTINGEMVPKINAAALAAKEWALANAAIFGNPDQMALFLARLEAVRMKATTVKTEFDAIGTAVNEGLVNGVSTGLNAAFDALQQVATGQATVAEGFRGMLGAFAEFAATFLREIATMIIKQMIFNALSAMGGFFGGIGNAGLASMGMSAGVKHSGGTVGGTNNRTASVSPSWFTNAPRYHAGGIAGLAPTEYPTILERGEEVLEKDSPRNVLNGGLNMGQNTAAGGSTRFVLVDDRARIPEAMSSAEGERVIIQTLRKNIPTLKQFMK